MIDDVRPRRQAEFADLLQVTQMSRLLLLALLAFQLGPNTLAFGEQRRVRDMLTCWRLRPGPVLAQFAQLLDEQAAQARLIAY